MTDLASSHYHSGEVELQAAIGAREKIEHVSEIMMRDHLIDQHREFYAGLEYIFVSAVDDKGRPHAAILSGPIGFVSTPDPRTLRIQLDADNFQLSGLNLGPGATIGVLGIDLSNRRRNRMHGRVVSVSSNCIDIRVVQSYGNCPKYITTRMLSKPVQGTLHAPVVHSPGLSDADRDLISKADTFFIASVHDSGQEAAYDGADMSHRGGAPGFVRLGEDDTITVPDYTGNNMFNTLGNLRAHPYAGLLFIKFDTGKLLHISGSTEIISEGADITTYPGAQRLLRIFVDTVSSTASGTSLRWIVGEPSPFNP